MAIGISPALLSASTKISGDMVRGAISYSFNWTPCGLLLGTIASKFPIRVSTKTAGREGRLFAFGCLRSAPPDTAYRSRVSCDAATV